jgi:hypothetical protein
MAMFLTELKDKAVGKTRAIPDLRESKMPSTQCSGL